MRMKRNAYLTLAALTMLPGTAMAHPGHEHELGMAHVLTSFEHLAAFMLVGVIAGVMTAARRRSTLLIANGMLALFLVVQGTMHAMHGGILFGLEGTIAGAALALGAWRLTHMVIERSLARKQEKPALKTRTPDRP